MTTENNSAEAGALDQGQQQEGGAQGAASGADLLFGAGQGEGQQGGQAETRSFLDGIEDPELKTWAENKKFPDLKTALESQRNLEKLLGGEKLPVPKDENDVEGRDRLYRALGRPDSPEGYELGKLEGTDPEFAKTAATWLHAAGVGKAQAALFEKGWNDYVAATTAAHQAAFDGQSQADIRGLRTEWASDFEANVEHSRRAARVLGLEADEAKAIEMELGTKRFLSMFAKIGQGIGEGEFIGGEGGGGRGFKMTPEQATARIAALRKDEAWQTRFISGGSEEKAEWERLHKIATPGAA